MGINKYMYTSRVTKLTYTNSPTTQIDFEILLAYMCIHRNIHVMDLSLVIPVVYLVELHVQLLWKIKILVSMSYTTVHYMYSTYTTTCTCTHSHTHMYFTCMIQLLVYITYILYIIHMYMYLLPFFLQAASTVETL